MQQATIFDMDGTLCDVSSVRHHVKGRERNFDAFHRDSLSCPPHHWVADTARWVHSSGHGVLILTGRMAKWREGTARWLEKWNIPFDELLTRADGDFRKDTVIKAELLANVRRRWQITEAIDDNPAIVELWRSEGIPTTVVPGWDD